MRRHRFLDIGDECPCAVPNADRERLPRRGGPLPRDPYITSTGETVDKPGLSQSGGITPEDLKIRRENNQIDNGICDGC